jgi:chitinase
MKQLLLLLCLSFALHASKDVYVIGYIPQYRIAALDEMDIGALTHVIAAFANPDSSGELSCPIDMDSFSSKVIAGGSSPVISIGGGGSYSWGADTTIYSHLYADSNRTDFIIKLVAYAQKYNCAGIDVDIEGTPLMNPLYNEFVQELADSLHANGLEIYSAYGVGSYAGAGYADSITLQKFDIIGTMSYGGVDNWSWSSQENSGSYERFKSDVEYFIERGVDPSKIAGGIPFYTVGYPSEQKDNYSDYMHTLGEIYSDSFYLKQNPFYNDTMVNSEGNPEYCNSFPTVKKKIDYMDQLGGGIMIWEVGQDNYGDGPNMLDSMASYIAESTQEESQFRVVGYSYGTDPLANDIDLTNYTHVIGSFVDSDSLGNLTFVSWTPEDEIVELLHKAESQGAVPMIALGTTAEGWEMTKSAASRANFISNILDWCDNNGVKGIDLDLEGTAEEYNWGNPGTFFIAPYESLAVELREAMPDSMILTAAVGSQSRNGAQWSDRFVNALDWINVMVYDRALSWESSPVENHSTYEGHLEAASYWSESRGIARDRIVLGVPFYARGWDRENNRIYREDGGWDVTTWNYKDFALRYDVDRTMDTLDFPASDSILYPRAEGVTGKGTLFFNGVDMIGQKTQWTLENSYGGVMVWHIAGDLPSTHELSLLRIMDSVINPSTALTAEVIQPAHFALGSAGGVLKLTVPGGNYRISLYDLRGRELAKLSNRHFSAGTHRVQLDANRLSPGLYIIRAVDLKSGESVSIKSMVH